MDRPWKVIVAFVGIFIAGAVFGGLLALRIENAARHEIVAVTPAAPVPAATRVKGQPPPAAKPILPLPQPMQAANLMKRFAERLDLTTEQRERIMPLIQRATQDFRRQQQAYFREDGIILQRLQEDIAKELTPVQREKLEKMQQRQKELVKKQREQFMERMKGAGGAEHKGASEPAEGMARPAPADAAAEPAAPASKPDADHR
jgi:hypothetical protein